MKHSKAVEYEGIIRNGSQNRLTVELNRTYKFMRVLDADIGETTKTTKYLVFNTCCKTTQWVRHVTFFRRLAKATCCKQCAYKQISKSMIEGRPEKPFDGIKGWGMFLKPPFGRLYERGSFKENSHTDKENRHTKDADSEYENRAIEDHLNYLQKLREA